MPQPMKPTPPTRKTFPVPATCSKCGHHDNLFIDDANLAKGIDDYARSRFGALWRPLMVRRIFVLLAVVGTIAFAAGWVLNR